LHMLKIKDKEFTLYLSQKELERKVKELGEQISKDYQGKSPIVLGVLNGAFMFLSDLMKEVEVPLELSFIKIASYSGTNSTGKVKEVIGLSEDVKGRHVLIVEDIVDTGLSMTHLKEMVEAQKPASIAIASLLVKPEALKEPIDIDYVGFDIPTKFVVGYGLDYDGFGRNLKEIYQLK